VTAKDAPSLSDSTHERLFQLAQRRAFVEVSLYATEWSHKPVQPEINETDRSHRTSNVKWSETGAESGR